MTLEEKVDLVTVLLGHGPRLVGAAPRIVPIYVGSSSRDIRVVGAALLTG